MQPDNEKPQAPRDGVVPPSQLDGHISSENPCEGDWNIGPDKVRGLLDCDE